MSKIIILKTFPDWERASNAWRQFVRDNGECYCKILHRIHAVELPNSVVYFAVMSEDKHLSIAYGAQYEYIDFHEGVDDEIKMYLQTRIRGLRSGP